MIKLLIADDHALIREGLKRIIEDTPEMELVGEAVNGNEILAKLRTTLVDVLLLDISMPGPGFLEVMRRLRANTPECKILVLSAHPEEQYAIRALKAGASGYLTKNHSPDELANAIRRIHKGGKYVSQAMAERLIVDLGSESTKALHESLSDREYQVLCMLGEGRKINEIAALMSVSPKTVTTYRARILSKMGLKNNAELILYAVNNNLLHEG